MTPELLAALSEIDRSLPPSSPAGRLVRDELIRLEALINNPATGNFLESVRMETAYQAETWKKDDARKEPADWFWTLGYLGGKALHAQTHGNITKALHHAVSSAALCSRWHEYLLGELRPPSVTATPLKVGDGIDHNLGGHGICTPKPAFP